MEISLVASGALKIRGKSAVFLVNGIDTQIPQAILQLGNKPDVKLPQDVVSFEGPGEYEVAGVKVTGIATHPHVVYTMTLERVSVTIGSIKALEALQKSIPESQIVIIDADAECDTAFISNFSPVVVIFYDTHATEAAKVQGIENIQTTSKYQVTAEKLPLEMETYILTNTKL